MVRVVEPALLGRICMRGLGFMVTVGVMLNAMACGWATREVVDQGSQEEQRPGEAGQDGSDVVDGFDGADEASSRTVAELTENTNQPITEAKAIELAKEAIAKDGRFSVDYTDRTVWVRKKLPKYWHVSFPFDGKKMIVGGEPHVILKQDTGEIVEIYHTR